MDGVLTQPTPTGRGNFCEGNGVVQATRPLRKLLWAFMLLLLLLIYIVDQNLVEFGCCILSPLRNTHDAPWGHYVQA